MLEGILWLGHYFVKYEAQDQGFYHSQNPDKNPQYVSTRYKKDTINVLTMGDSYTFGGWGKQDESYPSLLQGLFNKQKLDYKVNIVNNGMCERTSTHILNSLEHAISLNSPNILILLVGAANRFSPGLNSEVSNSIFKKSRTLKLLKMMKIYIQDLQMKKKVGQKPLVLSSRADRLSYLLNQLDIGKFKANDYELSEQLVRTFELQSHYSAKDVSTILLDIIKRNPQWTGKEKALVQAQVEKFKKFEKIDENYSKVLDRDFEEIIRITNKYGVKLVLATYPLEFVAANSVIRSKSKKYNLPLVDHFKTFDDLSKKEGYKREKWLEDNDHATKAGHEVMAKNTHDLLGSLIEKNKKELLLHGWED
jgi:lysophospholipase L1-like esterase